MRSTAVITMLLALFSAGSIAAQRRRAVAPAIDEMKIAFAGRGPLAAGLLDLGGVAHEGEAALRGRTVRRETVAVVVMRRSGIRGVATLRAWLAAPDPRCTVRINGIVLSGIPAVVDPQVQIGSESVQRIEIEVPVSVPEGALDMQIEWEAIGR